MCHLPGKHGLVLQNVWHPGQDEFEDLPVPLLAEAGDDHHAALGERQVSDTGLGGDGLAGGVGGVARSACGGGSGRARLAQEGGGHF